MNIEESNPSIKIKKVLEDLLCSIRLILDLFIFFSKKTGIISIDEEFQRRVGFYWLNYVLNFTPFDELKDIASFKLQQIKGLSLPTAKDNSWYGVIFDLPIAFLEVLFKIDDPKKYFHLRH